MTIMVRLGGPSACNEGRAEPDLELKAGGTIIFPWDLLASTAGRVITLQQFSGEECEVPGHHSADNQMRSFMIHKKSNTTGVAAAKAGFSRATGYRINQDPRLPSQKKAPRGRRRPDPLGGLFETDVVPLLEAHPAVRSVGLFKELLQRTPIWIQVSGELWNVASVTGERVMVPRRRLYSARSTCRVGSACRTSPA